MVLKSKIPKIVLNHREAMLSLKKELSGEALIKSFFKTRFVKRMISFGLVGMSGAGIISLMWLWVSVFNLNYLLSAAVAYERLITDIA